MNGIPWILVGIIVGIVVLGIGMVVAFRKRKEPRRVDYRNYFVMGVIWLLFAPIMVLLPWILHGEEPFFMGFVFLGMGIVYMRILEGECRKAINTVGLEPAFGFLHEPARRQTSQGLVYDLQEPFRWLCDVAVIEAFESGIVDMKDFYFLGDDYQYHIEGDSKRKFLELLKDRFNAGVRYKGKTWKWDTIILNKAQELARFLLRKSETIDFAEPAALERSDSLILSSIHQSLN